MAHIALDSDAPGIIGLFKAYPESARHFMAFGEHLLRAETPGLSRADRETIAAYVSRLSNCEFCELSHAGIAEKLAGRPGLVAAASCDLESSGLNGRMQALLRIAAKIQAQPKSVSDEDIRAARREGAADRDIHDTVLIAAFFCMAVRYVDGLGTALPPDTSFYAEGVERTIERGYIVPPEDM